MINNFQACQAFEAGGYCGEPSTIRFMNGWFCEWHTPDSKGATVSKLPTWLQQRLGTPTKGRGVKATKCLVCQKPILVGMSEDQMATRALVDPIALTSLGEMLALLEGRKTYRLGKYDQGLALWQRDHWQISRTKASAECIILTDHKCDGPNFPQIEIPLLPEKQKAGISDNDPPF